MHLAETTIVCEMPNAKTKLPSPAEPAIDEIEEEAEDLVLARDAMPDSLRELLESLTIPDQCNLLINYWSTFLRLGQHRALTAAMGRRLHPPIDCQLMDCAQPFEWAAAAVIYDSAPERGEKAQKALTDLESLEWAISSSTSQKALQIFEDRVRRLQSVLPPHDPFGDRMVAIIRYDAALLAWPSTMCGSRRAASSAATTDIATARRAGRRF